MSQRTPRFALLASLAALTAIAGCDSSPIQSSAGLVPGTIVANPQTGMQFVVEANSLGAASSLHIRRVLWGRLVDVYAIDATTGDEERWFADFLIGADIDDDADFVLERNPVTGVEKLTVKHLFPSDEFTAALARAESALQPVLDKGLDPGELPPFTAVPRNGAMAFVFDDLLDDGGNPGDATYPSSVNATTLRLRVGYPPTGQFEPRIIPDPNHGDLVGTKFHSTRVLVDLTVSQFESTTYSAPVNGLGLPAAINTSQPSVVLRIPTRVSASAGQLSILTNLSGAGVSFGGNGSTDPYVSSLDVVRAFRAGGDSSITGDAYNGFLADQDPPSVVGAQAVSISLVDTSGTDPRLDFQFDTAVCAVAPRTGDAIVLPGVVVEVTANGTPPVAGGVSNIPVRVLAGSASALVAPSTGEYRTPWSTSLGVQSGCFVAFSPEPGSAPAAAVSNQATFALRFSEPMDPASVRPFETLKVGPTTPPSNSTLSRVCGEITVSNDLTEFVFEPSVALSHAAAATESYTITVDGSATGVVDLAGNTLAAAFPATAFTLAAGSPSITSGGVSLTFSAVDEDPNTGPELRGQFIYDLARGKIRPRSLARFSGIADTSEPIVAMMPTIGSLQLPLIRYGCRLSTVWRYHDLGFRLLDDATLNIDVEGLNWSPATQGLAVDNFPEFQLALAHCRYLPDEEVSSSVALHPESGLTDLFADHPVDPVNDPLTVVHQRSLGYTVQPLDLFTAASGAPMTPWPLNQGKAPEDLVYWTWRDTSKLARGQPGPSDAYGVGADYRHVFATDPTAAAVYARNLVPTIGLPLLMDFRVYPNSTSSGANVLTAALANADPLLRPYFTAISAGGVLTTGQRIDVDPDQAIAATGVAGTANLPRQNIFFFGQGDFVIRVNRIHTAWFDTGNLSSFRDAVIDPPSTSMPAGTQVTLHYRGATGITGANSPWTNASLLDPYGNALPGTTFTVTFTNANSGWVSDITDLDGSRFVQIRITMLSNAVSGVSPEITSIGFPYYR